MVFNLITALQIIVSACVATGVMTVFALMFTRVGLLRMNPLEAIGSTVVEQRAASYQAGMSLHVFAGIAFGFLYSSLLGIFDPASSAALIFQSTAIGLAHGFVISFLIVVFVGEHDRWVDFRNEGIGLAGIYLVAHIIYGLIFGVLLAAFGALLISP